MRRMRWEQTGRGPNEPSTEFVRATHDGEVGSAKV